MICPPDPPSSESQSDSYPEHSSQGAKNFQGRFAVGQPAPGELFLSQAREIIERRFGFAGFRPGQERAIRAVGCGRDVVVVMPTGSGKSLSYQAPALLLPGVTLVVSPLIALMADQVAALEKRGISAACINSSIPVDEQWARLEAMQQGLYRLVYIAPERFRNRAFCRALAGVKVSLLAVDEAHCISQWGHDFRPDYRRLKRVRELLRAVPVIALTATATPQVCDDIVQELAMLQPERIITGFDRPNLLLRVERLRGAGQKMAALREFLTRQIRLAREAAPPAALPSGIIYTGTRRHAEEVVEFLQGEEWPEAERPALAAVGPQLLIRAYHAGLESSERQRVQEDFMRGRVPWIAATNAFGMGVDKRDIRFVVHYDLPGSIEAYYQEIGRGGRDGGNAECLLLYSPADKYLQEFFIDGANPSRQAIEEVFDFLWSLGENPVFRSLADLHAEFQSKRRSRSRLSAMALRSAVVILERSGALCRLDHVDNLAEIQAADEVDWSASAVSDKAPVRRRLWEGLRRVFERAEGESAAVHLESWAEHLELPLDSLKRALAHFAAEGVIRYVPPFRGRAIRLPSERRPLDDLGVDFKSLDDRRRQDEQELEIMVDFCRSSLCRRRLILEHFGDSGLREDCGRCDACCRALKAGEERYRIRPLSDEEFIVVRKVLSGIARVQGRCGRRRLVQMLTGSRSREVLGMGLEKLSTYGILRHAGRDDLLDLLQELESQDCLRQEGDPYPLLYLTERGRRVMKAEERPELAFPQGLSGSGARSAKSGTAAAGGAEAPAVENRELYDGLRELRRRLAKEIGLPAFRICNDRTLRALAELQPRTLEELLQVPGIGDWTLKHFGRRFLEEIRRLR